MVVTVEISAETPMGCTFQWSPSFGLVIKTIDVSVYNLLPSELQNGDFLYRFNGTLLSPSETSFDEVVNMIRECKGVRKFEFEKQDNAILGRPFTPSKMVGFPMEPDPNENKQIDDKNDEQDIDNDDDDDGDDDQEDDNQLAENEKQSKFQLFLNRTFGPMLTRKQLKREQKLRLNDLKLHLNESNKESLNQPSSSVLLPSSLHHPKSLNALHIESYDLSSWYAGRLKYGVKAHSYKRVWRVDASYLRQQKETQNSKRPGTPKALSTSSRPNTSGGTKPEWAAEIVRMGFRREDKALVAQRDRVVPDGKRTFRTETAAFRACEEAAKERDLQALEELQTAKKVVRQAAFENRANKVKGNKRRSSRRRSQGGTEEDEGGAKVHKRNSIRAGGGGSQRDRDAQDEWYADAVVEAHYEGEHANSEHDLDSSRVLFEETHVRVLVVSRKFIGLTYSQRIDLVVKCMEKQLRWDKQMSAEENAYLALPNTAESLAIANHDDTSSSSSLSVISSQSAKQRRQELFQKIRERSQNDQTFFLSKQSSLRDMSVVGEHVRRWRRWAGGGLLGLAAAGYPTDGSGVGFNNPMPASSANEYSEQLQEGLRCGAYALPMMQFDLRTPSQWKPEEFPPDAFERFDAGFRRDRLLHINQNVKRAKSGGAGNDGVRSHVKGSDVAGACVGSEPAKLASSSEFLSKVLKSSDESKLKEEKMRNNEERKLLLGIAHKDNKVQVIKPLDYDENYNDDYDSLESKKNRRKLEQEDKDKIQKMFIKYGATFFPETAEHKLTYLHQELMKREEEDALDADLRDKDPLPPQPRKKYLAHSLYGLGADHKQILVQQLNEELHAQHRQKKGKVVKGEHVAGKISVANGVGWGDGGAHVTHATVGKFKYQTLLLGSACVRMQRHWRSKAIPRALLRIQLAEKSALNIQKCVRAWIARSFVSLLKPLRMLACNLIQKIFRSKRERRIANAYRKLIYAASIKVQAVFRGWIGRVYFEFIVDHWRASIQIQRSVRGFLSRCTVKILKLAIMSKVFLNLPPRNDYINSRGSSARSSRTGRSRGRSRNTTARSGLQSSTSPQPVSSKLSARGVRSVSATPVSSSSSTSSAVTGGAPVPNNASSNSLRSLSSPPQRSARSLQSQQPPLSSGRSARSLSKTGRSSVKGGGPRIAHIFTPGGLYGPAFVGYKPGGGLPPLEGPKGLIPIQAAFRAYPPRPVFQKRLDLLIADRIWASAALLLQRVFRGYMGTKDLARRRRERDGSIQIQRVARGKSARIWRRRVKEVIRERRIQVHMQAFGRGFVTRRWYEIQYRLAFNQQVELPAAIQIESVARMRRQFVLLSGRKQAWWASTLISNRFRLGQCRQRVIAQWTQRWFAVQDEAATRIQCLARRHLAVKHFGHLRLEEAGKRVYAARVIVRAWLRCRDMKRFRALKEAWELEQSNDIIEDVLEEGEELLLDLEDIADDILVTKKIYDRSKFRDRKLAEYDDEAKLRHEVVEEELEEMFAESEDQDSQAAELITSGWGDALVAENNAIKHKRAMAVEERRLRRVQAKRSADQMDRLQLEFEDLEVDIDENTVAYLQEQELVRRIQLERGDVRAAENLCRNIRLEKCKWAVDDIRRKLIAQHTEAEKDQMLTKLREGRSIAQLSTLEHHKIKDMDLEEKHEVEKTLRQKRRAAAREVVKNGYEGKPLRESYDAVVATMMGLLKAQTLEARDVSEDLGDGANHPAGSSEGDNLLNDPDSGVQFVPVLKKKDSRSNKALMRRLHGYAPTDRAPVIEESEEEGAEADEFEDVDEFG